MADSAGSAPAEGAGPQGDIEVSAENLLAVVATGHYRASLEVIRDELAAGLLEARDRSLIHLPAIAKQLVEVLERLETMPSADSRDSVNSAQDDTEALLRLVR